MTDPTNPPPSGVAAEMARDDFLKATTEAKAHAEAVLRELQAASEECETQLQKQRRTDPMRLVTGKSSLDAAITTTKRMIETFERAVQDAKRSADLAAKASVPGGNGASPSGAAAPARADHAVRVVPVRLRAGLA